MRPGTRRMKMNKLPLRLSEIDNVRITRQTRWAVHFEIMQRYYVLKQMDDACECGFTLYLKPLKGGRGHWKAVCSGWGDLPTPRYKGKRVVYCQADVHEWMMRLVNRNIVTLVTDCPDAPEGYRALRKEELMKALPVEDVMTVFGIRSCKPICDECKSRKNCSVQKLGITVLQCDYSYMSLNRSVGFVRH